MLNAKLLKNTFVKESNHLILFSALDWGLGHTTRSIPILHFFNTQNTRLLLAVNPGSASEKILQKHFPDADFLALEGYNITYARNKRFFALKIIRQIPKILKAIRKERQFVKATVEKHSVNMIISDNRYGFYHPSVHSVFITHQLCIAAPFRWLERLIQKINYNYIHRFNELWIPDFEGIDNIAGKLSHPEQFPDIQKTYIGPLSRLILPSPIDMVAKGDPISYLILLSGPEPSRSILEHQLLSLLPQLPGRIVMVRGVPKSPFPTAQSNSFQDRNDPERPVIIDYADQDTLKRLLQQAEFVVCRSGYSTVMDLLILGKKGIYIPTPGQTEQQYLAERLRQQSWGYSVDQDDANMAGQLINARTFPYHLPQFAEGIAPAFLKKRRSEWLDA